MKRLIAFSVVALSAVVLAQDKIKIQPKYTADSSTSYKLLMKMNVGGVDAELSGTMVAKVKAVGEAETRVEYDWQNGKAIVNGEDTPVPFAPTTVTYTPKGALAKIEGGIEGTDVARTFLTVYAHLPAEEIAKGGTWNVKLPADANLDLTERTIEGTFEGEEELLGKKVRKLKIKLTESSGFKTTQTAYVDSNGLPVKIEGSFSDLPVPIAGENATGTVTLELITK